MFFFAHFPNSTVCSQHSSLNSKTLAEYLGRHGEISRMEIPHTSRTEEMSRA